MSSLSVPFFIPTSSLYLFRSFFSGKSGVVLFLSLLAPLVYKEREETNKARELDTSGGASREWLSVKTKAEGIH